MGAYPMSTCKQPFIDRCLAEAMVATSDERRNRRRYPFFRPISLSLGDDSRAGFCRDVSRGGMGLLHMQPIESGSVVTVSMATRRVAHLDLRCEVRWCSQLGERCFLSGVSFCDLTAGRTLTLVAEVIREELQRRVQKRYPFFRPIMIRSGSGAVFEAYCRDISRGGMGLLLRQQLPAGRAVMTMTDMEGDTCEVSLDVRWCQPVAEDWFLGGATFSNVWLEEIPAKLL